MATEIERKFLVRRLPDLHGVPAVRMAQGYLRADARGSVRVRIAGDAAYLTVKGPSRGRARLELEYSIPAEDARLMMDALAEGEIVEKVRYRIEHQGYVWELDVFSGRNEGLVLAEVELDHVDEQPPLPPWVGGEVSDDARFFNARLAREPYDTWTEKPSVQ